MKTAALLDLNVLMALAWPSHEHHEAAHRWFHSHGKTWATCPFTQVGFVRLSSNPTVVDPPAAPVRAGELLRKLTAHPRHAFWKDDLDVRRDGWPKEWVRGHRQTTDAHLIRLARRHKGRLATFDTALETHAPDAVVVLPRS